MLCGIRRYAAAGRKCKMKTKIVRIEEENIDRQAIREAGEILKAGGLVAFPTETVYGLGGDALNGASSGRSIGPKEDPRIIR